MAGSLAVYALVTKKEIYINKKTKRNYKKQFAK